jgi:ABC-2 type transport system ATP-binding protein
VFGRSIIEESFAVRRRIGYLPQHPSFFAHMTARQVLQLSAQFFIADQKKIEHRIGAMLDLVDLLDKADRRIGGFSGGEIQRLGIAQAQIHEPELLILDEPAAALDPMGREQVLNIMQRLRERSTIFFSTHILDDVQRVGDEVAILNRGRLVVQAPVERLLARRNAKTYILRIRGDRQLVEKRLAQLQWISRVELEEDGRQPAWRITVTDEEQAERHLLRTILADKETAVLEFGRAKAELEDVFRELVLKDG